MSFFQAHGVMLAVVDRGGSARIYSSTTVLSRAGSGP